MRLSSIALVLGTLAVTAAGGACGSCGATENSAPNGDNRWVLGDPRDFAPTSFTDQVTGKGRPVIFIPGLGCPGDVWQGTVAHFNGGIEAHVLTLAGFAGSPPIKSPLAATVRDELARYIRAHRLQKPIIVGHSLGGFVAYWLAATTPDLIGGVVVVDEGPALGQDAADPDAARALRNLWAQADDDVLAAQVRTAFTSMVGDPKEIEPFLAAISKSDRRTLGDAVYEVAMTDLRAQVAAIRAPLLLVLADGSNQLLYTAMVKDVPHHDVVVIPKTKHFVMFDAPKDFDAQIDKFLADHPSDRD